MKDKTHHILRLDSNNDFETVCNNKRYLTSMTSVNGWSPNTVVIFLKKIKLDSVIGYGIIEAIPDVEDLTQEEQERCDKTGNRFVLRLHDLNPLDPPKLVKETAIGKWPYHGNRLHGKGLTEKELGTILPMFLVLKKR